MTGTTKLIMPIAVTTNLVIQEIDSKLIIYDLRTNKAHYLSETTAAIWQRCDGTKSVEMITLDINRKFNCSIEEDIIWLAIYGLQIIGLLIIPEEMNTFLD